VLKAQLQRAQSADVCSACGAKEGEPCRGNCERRMPSHVLHTELLEAARGLLWLATTSSPPGKGSCQSVIARIDSALAGAGSATERSGCPCTVEGIEPCSYACSCANPVMSGGCQRCALYGSLEQRQAAARRLIRSNRPADQTDGLAADFLRRTESGNNRG
jgi:hypothetical protein